MASIGIRIIELIKEKGMSQKEFSKKTGIPQSTISDWKGKGLNPNVDKIMIICDVLDISPQDLLSSEEAYGDVKRRYIYIDEDSPEYNIVVEYRKLGERDRMRMEGYLAALKTGQKNKY